MSQISVSVIMPAYNAERFIKESIESVLGQTYSDWELIIIDDCSRDRTLDIVKCYSLEDERIRVFRNETNQGVAKSRNRGIASAKGEWIAFLDSDDIWDKDKIRHQLAFAADRSDAQLTYTASAFIDEKGSRFTYILEAEDTITYRELLRKNLLSCSSVMVKRELLKEFSFPDGELHEDYAVWLQLLRELPYAYGLNEPLLIYRLANNSRSSGRIKSGKMVYRTYRFVGYGIIASLALTLRYFPYSIKKRSSIYQSIEGTQLNG